MSKPYLLYGRRTVAEFLASGEARAEDVEAVLAMEGLPAGLRDALEEEFPGRIQTMRRREIEDLYPDINHQGIVIRLHGVPSRRAKEEILGSHQGPIVVLDGIQDPQNLGAILRTAEAMGVHNVFITGRGAAPGPAVDRASSGAVFHLRLEQASSAAGVLRRLKDLGYWIVVSAQPNETDAHPVERLTDLPPSEDLVLVLGSEGAGVRAITAGLSDYAMWIPLKGRTASLNVSVAAGVLLDRIIARRE